MISTGHNDGVLATAASSRGSVVWGLGRLIRPANIITAYADILAGFGAASSTNLAALPLLLLSTTGLYGGGIVFNDVFDAKLDSVERPERPIPSGLISLRVASIFGALLLIAGVLLARLSSPMSGAIAFATATSALLYDTLGKRHSVIGPINMGLCRGLNLLLGVTAAGVILPNRWLLAAVPLCYIAGITSLSRGEVTGGNRKISVIAVTWLAAALTVFAVVAVLRGPHAAYCLPFIAVLLFRVCKPLGRALQTSSPSAIRGAIKAGILSLILLNAGLAAIFAEPWYAGGILLLYIPAAALAKLFAVT